MEPKSKTASKMLRSDVRGQVLEFFARFDHYIGAEYAMPPREVADLRHRLIQEECDELKEAIEANDYVKAVDALADLLYTVEGAVISFGVFHHGCMNAVSEEVHRSNMSKLGRDGRPVKREDGKTLKGPDYSPANISAVLMRFGWLPT